MARRRKLSGPASVERSDRRVGGAVGLAVGGAVGLAVGALVGPALGGPDGCAVGVGLDVGLGVALIPQVVDDDARLVLPVPAEGIVSKPSGRVPAGVNSRAAIALIFLRSGSWIEPRLS